MKRLGCFVNDIISVTITEKYTKQFTQLIINAITKDRDAAIRALQVAQGYAQSDNKHLAAFGLNILDSIELNSPHLKGPVQTAKADALSRPPKKLSPRHWLSHQINRFMTYIKS